MSEVTVKLEKAFDMGEKYLSLNTNYQEHLSINKHYCFSDVHLEMKFSS